MTPTLCLGLVLAWFFLVTDGTIFDQPRLSEPLMVKGPFIDQQECNEYRTAWTAQMQDLIYGTALTVEECKSHRADKSIVDAMRASHPDVP